MNSISQTYTNEDIPQERNGTLMTLIQAFQNMKHPNYGYNENINCYMRKKLSKYRTHFLEQTSRVTKNSCHSR